MSDAPSMNANLSDEMEMLSDLVKNMVDNWRYQARVDTLAYSLLVVLYAAMIIFGATGNIMVITVVAGNPAMRTARNVFIVNLAVSDLMLCLITMPLTLVEILYMTWQFGDYPAACPVAALMQGTSIFVSTLSITAIALDRRRLIVYPHKEAFGIKAMLACVPLIWGLALALASPMAIWKKLEYWTEWTNLMDILDSPSPNSTEKENLNCTTLLYGPDAEDALSPFHENQRTNCMIKEVIPKWLNALQSCKEDFPGHGRLIYSAVTMVIQYLLPTVTISVAYFQIYGQLRIRIQQKRNQLAANTVMTNGSSNPASSSFLVDRIENDIQRMRKTVKLLISVGLIFCVCWLPLNILNTIMDITEKNRIDEHGKRVTRVLTDQQFCILYAVCHVTGMLSACANPVIYGFLNENFNREFKDLLGSLKKKCSWITTCFCAKKNQQSIDLTQEQNHEENRRPKDALGKENQEGVEMVPLFKQDQDQGQVQSPQEFKIIQQHAFCDISKDRVSNPTNL